MALTPVSDEAIIAGHKLLATPKLARLMGVMARATLAPDGTCEVWTTVSALSERGVGCDNMWQHFVNGYNFGLPAELE